MLCEAGLRIGHERMREDGCVSAFFAVDDYYYPAKHRERRGDFAFENVWHLVRSPLRVIGSLAGRMSRGFWHWQQVHTRIRGDLPPVERAMRFWLAWTAKCDAIAQHRILFEDLPSRFSWLLTELGVARSSTPSVPHVGQSAHADLDWQSLASVDKRLARMVSARARIYGYANAEGF